MKLKFIIFTLIVGLLSACGSQPTEAPASPPTEEPATATATAVPTDTPSPTDTAIPPTDTVTPTEEPTAEASGVSFTNDIIPIIQSRCYACHGGDKGTEEGLDMNSYANLMAGSYNGPVVVAGNADDSLIVQMLVKGKMPKRGPKLTPPQVQLIIDWINQGALDN